MAVVDGGNVSLTWNAPAGGGVPGGYVLEAGSGPGLSNIATLPRANTSFDALGVPAGTYFVRVAATSTFGTGLPSNEVSFSVGNAPQPGPPGTPIATVTGSTVTLAWAPPATGGVPTGYTIIAGTSPGAGDAGVFPVGAATTFTATGVSRGTYFVRVAATNAAGAGPASGEVVVVVP